MNAEELLLAMGDIRDELVADAALAPAKRKRVHLRLKPALAACLVMAMLALTVNAEMDNGYISNLLAPLYGYAQTEIVNKIGQPIGASVTVGDYVLTAEAVIGDKYNLAIVYSLTKQNGEVLEDDLAFSTYSNSLHRNGGASYSRVFSEDKTKLYIVEKWTGTDDLMWSRKASVSFSDLIVKDPMDGTLIRTVQAGTWDLQFTLRYEDASQKVKIAPFSVMDADGISLQIEEILLSPIGIHIKMRVPNPRLNGIQDGWLLTSFSMAVVLSSSDVIEVNNCEFGYQGKVKADQQEGYCSALFETPINISDIQELIVCDTAISLADKW